MGINEIQAKSVLQKSNLPDADYVINPYTGCVHGCVYCYARFMKRFTGHTEAWGAFLDAKVNAPKVLKSELAKRREPIKETVFLSSVTDPYIPAEAKYRLTREILEIILEHQAPLAILTKSDLILRDIDLLGQFESCSVGLSLMTTDDEIAKRFEPRAPSPTRRIQALKQFSASGIATYAFISPYLPKLSDIEQLMQSLDGLIAEVGVEAFNPRGANWRGVEQILARYYPALLPDYEKLVKDDHYWSALEKRARNLAAGQNISFMGFYRH